MNTNELNRVLSDEIYKLRAGKAKPERTNAVVRAAATMISNARLQLAYMKVAGANASLPFFGINVKPALPGTSARLAAKKKR